MKSLSTSFWTVVALLSLSLLLSGCNGKSMDYQGYSAPDTMQESRGNDHSSGISGPTNPERGMGSFNNERGSGISGPTNPARGTERHE